MKSVEIAQRFIACPSVTDTANDAVTELYRAELDSLGFECKLRQYMDLHGTEKFNLEAKRAPRRTASRPGIGYFCHNDVVSTEGWQAPFGGPLDAVVADQRLWGRGACDMKGSAAAAMAALGQVDLQAQDAPIYFFATGDEECGMSGARLLANESEWFAEMVASQAVGIIGEPTEMRLVHAHKGGCHLEVSSQGVAAHSSTVEAQNANWQLIPYLVFLRELAERCEVNADLKNEQFSPPTLSLNAVIENVPAAPNISVGQARCRIFYRPMPETNWLQVQQELIRRAEELQLDVLAQTPLPPMNTHVHRPIVQDTLALLHQEHAQTVCFATDGCWFQDLQELIVLGPGSIAQAHRPDEWIAIEQLEAATQIFGQLFRHHACS